MAGYETRQGGRQTFASAPVAPTQSRPSFTGASAGARVVGGESIGGLVGGEITTPGPIGGELGEFFGAIMEPHIQRRQQEGYLKGAIAQMGAKAGEEIRASNGGFSKIFGPTSYEAGAIFYGANKAVADFGNEIMADMDTFQQMKPDDFSMVLADKMEALTTGDRFTDQATQAAIFENLGPLVETHTKRRYVWQQNETKSRWLGNLGSQSDLLQAGAVNLASLTDPSDGESSALSQLADNFGAAGVKPADMDDATYKGAIYDFLRGAAQKGNGYAVQMMMSRGFGDVLDEDDRQKLEDQIAKYGNRAAGEAMQQPELVAMMQKLRVMESIGFKDASGIFRRASAVEMSEAMEAINQTVRRKTGFDIDIFDWKEVDGTVKSALAATKAAYDRAESRRWQIEDREDAQAHQAAEREAEEAKTTAQIGAMYGTGDIKVAIASKIGTSADYDLLSMQDYNAGNFAPLVRNYRVGSYVPKLVSDAMQHKLRQSLGDQYTDATKMAYEEWKQMYKAHPAAAAAFYGPTHPMLLAFDNLQTSLGPNLAYQRAFKNPARFTEAAIAPAQRKEAEAAINSAISSEEPWKWAFTNTPIFAKRYGLNAHSKRVYAAVLSSQVAIASQNTNLSGKILTAQAVEQAEKNGRLERYGALVIQNKPNTKPLRELLHLKTEDADAVVMGLVDKKLRAAVIHDGGSGYAGVNGPGAYGDEVQVERMMDDSGKPMLFVQSTVDDAAHPSSAFISWQELWDATQKHIAGKIAKVPVKAPITSATLRKAIADNKARVAARDVRPGTRIDILEEGIDAAAAVGGAVVDGVTHVATGISNRVNASARKRAARRNKH